MRRWGMGIEMRIEIDALSSLSSPDALGVLEWRTPRHEMSLLPLLI